MNFEKYFYLRYNVRDLGERNNEKLIEILKWVVLKSREDYGWVGSKIL